MDFQEQQKKFEELKNQFAQLNTVFDETMKKNKFSEEDLKIDENALSSEEKQAWEKIKSDVQNSAKAHANDSAPNQSSKAGIGRRNAIRL